MNMKTRMILALGLLLALLVALMPMQSATAGDTSWGKAKASQSAAGDRSLRDITWGRKAWGTDVTHSRNDSGYAAPIRVRCNTGTVLTLYTGQHSHSGPAACSLSGVDAIYAGPDQAVRCFNQLPPYNTPYFIGGWRSVGSVQSLDCFMQRPL